MTKTVDMRLLFGCALISLVWLGCKSEAEHTAKRAPVPLAAPSKKKPDTHPGVAYLGVKGQGVFALANGEVRSVIAAKNGTRDLELGGDGKVYASLQHLGTYRISGLEAEKLGDQSFVRIAAAADGTVTGMTGKTLQHHDGSKWHSTARGPRGSIPRAHGLAMDSAGYAYVANDENLRMRAPGQRDWKIVDISAVAGDNPQLGALAATPDGAVYFAFFGRGARRLVRIERGKLSTMRLSQGAWFLPKSVTVVPSGQVLSWSSAHYALFGPGDTSMVVLAKDMAVDPIIAFSATGDGRGRVWLATKVGVMVFDASGKQLAHWRPGTVPGLSGEVRRIVVTAGGPELPKPAPARKGTVIGRVVMDGVPLAGKRLEMCLHAKRSFKRTPCEDAETILRGKTDVDGRFRIEDVPVGPWEFGVEAGSSWTAPYLSFRRCCSALSPGGTLDIGAVRILAPKRRVVIRFVNSDPTPHTTQLMCAGSSKTKVFRRSSSTSLRKECDIVGGTVKWPVKKLKHGTRWRIKNGQATPN